MDLNESLAEAFEMRDKMTESLKTVDELTLMKAQVDVQHLLGAIGSLEGQLYQYKVDVEERLLAIKKIDIAIDSLKDLCNKTQRAISQALKSAERGL